MNRRREQSVPLIVLERASTIPLHRQIYSQIAEAVRCGEIRKQARLPSTRAMATLLRVSRNTVLAAYDELVAAGLLYGERGSGMRVKATGHSAFGLQHTIRAANYPARVLCLRDQDGNPLYFNF